ncbi:MAG: type IV secretory system conjugative DNA transfer family protein [Acidimicrobiales bacterium]
MNDRPPLGRRTWNSVPYGPMVRLDARSSLLVVGPTQSGKTSSLVVPAILSWTGAVVVTSVKNDVVQSTRAWRSSLGTVELLQPGREDGLTWNPLEGVRTFRHALRVARDLTSGSTRNDSDFWNSLATKVVAAVMVLALDHAADIFDVALVLERRNFDQWLHERTGGEAGQVLASFLEHDARTVDGVLVTAETMMLPWRFRQPLSSVRGVLGGANTLYLCSPRGEQVHYDALFRGALRMILEEQQRLVDRGTQTPLLMVLDEAATVGSLDELDQMAATVSGLDVTLVTVVQDFSQLHARWGARAATIVNNHSTRMVLAGLADATLAKYLPELVEPVNERPVLAIRQRPRGTAQVVAGAKPVFVVRLRPWWCRRRLRRRARVDSVPFIHDATDATAR